MALPVFLNNTFSSSIGLKVLFARRIFIVDQLDDTNLAVDKTNHSEKQFVVENDIDEKGK